MAASSPPLLLFFFLFLLSSSSIPFSSSRTVPYEYSQIDTAFLDVSATLEQTLDVLSFSPQTLQEEPLETVAATAAAAPGSFLLRLHPRETLTEPTHEDYRSLVLTRLARDTARVDSLNAKLALALGNVTRSDLKPDRSRSSELLRPEDLSTPVMSGTSQGSGEYFSRVGVGSPPGQYYMVLDTGSDVNWLQCQPCADCYQQADPVYNPSASSTHRALTCGAPQCAALEVSSCRSNQCLYQVSYGDGSFTVGNFVTETLTFGNSGKVNDVALGCGHDNEGLFVGSAGLLGLGGGPLSLTNQIKTSSFSYCLVDRDSTKSSTLEFNTGGLAADSVTAPLVKNSKMDTFYYVGLTGMSVGGSLVSIPPSLFQMDDSGNGGIIVDSGTAITRLQTEAYNSLRDAFVKMTKNLKPASGFALFDTCYDFSSLSQVRVPTVSFHFAGGKALTLPAKNYLIPVDSAGTFCFAFAPTSSSMSIIGNVQQQGTRVAFDLASSLVGFSPNKC
ncbi:protein ASPARTIC PROTEASE IN GUARD CELL 1-like [Punica granatum]|uniref:Protein ASPARTIC PROTEASE IN GUARD CELL 1-like n=1 Tax=Punica granatum TaxID=22663 RepID=A0A218Y187_PUNGR|nr:protein ASPARTIC PROTEASE IN GUARD CELL 1-like [Punica granatum]OWM90312.1 hypothetical protein CDL15_Pgr014614 [Punica granatum]